MSDSHIAHIALRVDTPDRTSVAQELMAHHRAGRLDQAELDARLALAAAARTEDDLRLVALDLPDVAVRPDPASFRPVALPSPPPRRALLAGVTDVTVMLLTLAAFVCTGLLFSVALGLLADGQRVALGLASFGSFTIGAGAVHLAHRVYGAAAQRG